MNLLRRIIVKFKKDGFAAVCKSVLYWSWKIYISDKIPAYVSWPVHVLRKHRFECGGRLYTLFFHPYNKTWTNERMVEVPIIYDAVQYTGLEKKILEIGNVLSHYVHVKHSILDLYEKGEMVINQDAAEIIGFDNQFDLIVSISTMEHIGWDCGEKVEKDKVRRAVESIRKCLTDSGVFIFTVPIGYNPYVDALIRDNIFTDVNFLRRVGKKKWKEVDKKEALTCAYGSEFFAANAVAIVTITKREL